MWDFGHTTSKRLVTVLGVSRNKEGKEKDEEDWGEERGENKDGKGQLLYFVSHTYITNTSPSLHFLLPFFPTPSPLLFPPFFLPSFASPPSLLFSSSFRLEMWWEWRSRNTDCIPWSDYAAKERRYVRLSVLSCPWHTHFIHYCYFTDLLHKCLNIWYAYKTL